MTETLDSRLFCGMVINAAAAVESRSQEINELNGTGAVSVDGKIRTARSKDGTPIPVGERVTVHEIRGVRLIVGPEPEDNI